tara:strand:+ start:1972 stop:3426 length:1455 start_codon:yes stop_codon:yes gene_type:complete
LITSNSQSLKALFLNLVVLITFVSVNAIASDTEEYVAQLKRHYEKSNTIEAFSLTHRYLGRSDPYQSWDYQAPSRYQAFKVTDIDMVNRHYAQNVVHWYSGGLLTDEVHFQNDSESFRYERNGSYYGKGAVKQPLNSFERYKSLTFMNIDFFAVAPLFEEKNVTQNISKRKNEEAGQTTLIHKKGGNKTIEYTFNDNPLRLSFINNKVRSRIYEYDDYITQNGITFARSVIKYYNGDTIPSYITVNEKFSSIKEIEPEKLNLPSEYNQLNPIKDKGLKSQQISPNLYVISNVSANQNILIKLIGNNIMVLGAPSSNRSGEQLLEHIDQKFPDKKVVSVYVTHPYSDHIGSLAVFAERGITIFADSYTIAAINEYPRFSKLIDTFKFQHIKHNQKIDGVKFYVLENSRSKRQSFAYIEDHGVIYQADFLEIASDNTIPKLLPRYSKRFIEFIRTEKLQFTRIVGQHRNNHISLDVVNRAYQANTI